jgi:hypothetical protein
MHFRLVDARQVHNFTLRLTFSDGVEGEIDLGDELGGPIFEPLSSNSKCNTTGPDGLRCCHVKTMLHTLECGRP